MKKYLQLFAFVLLLSVAAVSCGTDDSDTYTEIPNPNPEPETPASPVVLDLNAVPYSKLSDYNFFEGDIKNLEPVYRVIPYDLNSGLFTDYAQKKRFVWMPDNVKATYTEDGKILDFPVGTVLIKNFYYDKMQPSNTKKILETRIMIKKESGWIFANYVWNDEQTEASLNNEGMSVPIAFEQRNAVQNTVYRIPGTEECMQCHMLNGVNTPIGPKPQNLNKMFTYTDGAKNQLLKWIETGYLTTDIPQNIASTVDWTDENQSLDIRARSYLDINCAHCHSPGGVCDYTPMNLAFNATGNPVNLGICIQPQDFAPEQYPYLITASDPLRSLIYYRINTTIPSDMMPRVGRSLIDAEGTSMLWYWINEMPDTCE